MSQKSFAPVNSSPGSKARLGLIGVLCCEGGNSNRIASLQTAEGERFHVPPRF